MKLKGSLARNAMAWELVQLYGADGARARCCGEMLAAVEAEIAADRPGSHGQGGAAPGAGSTGATEQK